jgi:hypothetical protein
MRYVVVVSIVLTTAIATSLLWSFAADPEITGLLAILFMILVGKDFLIVGLRWSDPFDRLDRARMGHTLEAT